MTPYLYHYGVKGMKLGVRRDRAKQAYKSARKSERKAQRAIPYAGGAKAVSAQKRYEQAHLNTVRKKAAYNAAKKKDSAKARKAEFNTYRREMYKSGIQGSVKDILSDRRGTALYNDLKRRKGKEYADLVEKKVKNQAIAQIVGGTAVAVGSTAASVYLQRRYMW